MACAMARDATAEKVQIRTHGIAQGNRWHLDSRFVFANEPFIIRDRSGIPARILEYKRQSTPASETTGQPAARRRDQTYTHNNSRLGRIAKGFIRNMCILYRSSALQLPIA